jgi:hypothetical protein
LRLEMGLFEANVQKTCLPSNRTNLPLESHHFPPQTTPLSTPARGLCRGQQGMGSGSAGDGLSNDQVMQLLLANDASPNTLGRMYLSLHRRGGAAAAGDTEGGTPLPAEPAPPAAAPPPRRTVAPGVGVMPQQQGPVRATRPVTSSRGDASARPGRPPRTAQGARSMPADTRAARALFEFSGGDACAPPEARPATTHRAGRHPGVAANEWTQLRVAKPARTSWCAR